MKKEEERHNKIVRRRKLTNDQFVERELGKQPGHTLLDVHGSCKHTVSAHCIDDRVSNHIDSGSLVGLFQIDLHLLCVLLYTFVETGYKVSQCLRRVHVERVTTICLVD